MAQSKHSTAEQFVASFDEAAGTDHAEHMVGADAPAHGAAGQLEHLVASLVTSTAFRDEVDVIIRDGLVDIIRGTHTFEVFWATMCRAHDAALKVLGAASDQLEVEELADEYRHWLWRYIFAAMDRMGDELGKPPRLI
jgi:hypothetical protein